MHLSTSAWKSDGKEVKGKCFAGDHFDLRFENGETPDFYTVYTSWEITVVRARGLYELGTAKGEMEIDHTGGKKSYLLRMKGTNLEDLRKLYQMVKAGAIAPVLSFEERQVKGTDNRPQIGQSQTFKPRLLLVGRSSRTTRRAA